MFRIHPFSVSVFDSFFFVCELLSTPEGVSRHRNAKSNREIPCCLPLLPTSWVIYKTWQSRQCFDWQESYETICILSFMVCSAQSDQLSTALVLLYATPRNPVRAMHQPCSRKDKLPCGLNEMQRLHWHFHAPISTHNTACLYVIPWHHDRNRNTFLCPPSNWSQRILPNTEWKERT